MNKIFSCEIVLKSASIEHFQARKVTVVSIVYIIINNQQASAEKNTGSQLYCYKVNKGKMGKIALQISFVEG